MNINGKYLPASLIIHILNFLSKREVLEVQFVSSAFKFKVIKNLCTRFNCTEAELEEIKGLIPTLPSHYIVDNVRCTLSSARAAAKMMKLPQHVWFKNFTNAIKGLNFLQLQYFYTSYEHIRLMFHEGFLTMRNAKYYPADSAVIDYFFTLFYEGVIDSFELPDQELKYLSNLYSKIFELDIEGANEEDKLKRINKLLLNSYRMLSQKLIPLELIQYKWDSSFLQAIYSDSGYKLFKEGLLQPEQLVALRDIVKYLCSDSNYNLLSEAKKLGKLPQVVTNLGAIKLYSQSEDENNLVIGMVIQNTPAPTASSSSTEHNTKQSTANNPHSYFTFTKEKTLEANDEENTLELS